MHGNIDAFFEKHNKNKEKISRVTQKLLLLDFDHVVGDFQQISKVISCVESVIKRKLSYNEINKVFEKFDFIFRPKVFEVFQTLYHHKNRFILIAISTNSSYAHFVETVLNYIYTKLNIVPVHDIILHNKDDTNKSLIMSYLNKQGCSTIICHIDHKSIYGIDPNICLFIQLKKYIYKYSKNDILKIFPFKTLLIDNKRLSIKKKINEKKFSVIKYNLPRSSYNASSMKLIAYIHEFICIT